MSLLIAFVSVVLCLAAISLVEAFHSTRSTMHRHSSLQLNGQTGGNRWDDYNSMRPRILGPLTVLKHMGEVETAAPPVDVDQKKRAEFNLNVGKALEALRRDLPMVFYLSNIDFSVFANQITVADGNQNRLMMQKSLYIAAIKSLHMAAAFSTIYPSINLKKIEYIEDCRTIQCLVDVVLPDSVRVEGQAMWEGIFYFGLDGDGLINSHIFDRKISNLRPSLLSPKLYPWITALPSWQTEKLQPGLIPIPNSNVPSLAEVLMTALEPPTDSSDE